MSFLFAHAFLSFSGHAGKFETLDGQIWEFDPKTRRYSTPVGRYVSVMGDVYGEFKAADKKLHCLMIFKMDRDRDYTFSIRTFGGTLWQQILFKPLDATMDHEGSEPRCRVNEPPVDGFERFIKMDLVPRASSSGDYENAISAGRIKEKLPGEWCKLTDDYLEKRTEETNILQYGLVCTNVELVRGGWQHTLSFGDSCINWGGNTPRHIHKCQNGQLIETTEKIWRRSMFARTSASLTRRTAETKKTEIRVSPGSKPQTLSRKVPGHGGQCPAHPDAGGLGAIGDNTGCPRKQL